MGCNLKEVNFISPPEISNVKGPAGAFSSPQQTFTSQLLLAFTLGKEEEGQQIDIQTFTNNLVE